MVRAGAWSWIVIVSGESSTLAATLHGAGALVIVDPAVAGFCAAP